MSARSHWEELGIQREGRIVFLGNAWRYWGIYRAADGDYVVIHLPSLRRLTQFERKAHARRWCEAIDNLTDWSRLPPESEARSLSLQMHRKALHITGAWPAFVSGGT
jgi:hypothetical protein